MAVFNFGSINIDHVYQVPHFVNPGETLASSGYTAILGGKGANQSIACAKAGITTYHVGSIHSNDANMLSPMLDAGVNMQFVAQQGDTASGHAIIQVNTDGENAIILYPGANHLLDANKIEKALSGATANDWMLLQNETNEIKRIIEHAHNKGIPVAFNPAPMTDEIKSLPLNKLSLLIVNEIEAMQLTECDDIEQATNALMTLANDLQIVLTLGKQGVRYMHKSQNVYVSAYCVDATDTTAAGDTFIGFFLAHFSAQKNIKEALKLACAASAISVTRPGASSSIPSLDEARTFLKAQENT
ncbi:ribokinase [Glaciecola siphonariae]|uniref:Ribokinase n=1 Tax=Glaciecola siphonariae TaxID=521012 RepID=A0ABV9LVT7_9ALTE